MDNEKIYIDEICELIDTSQILGSRERYITNIKSLEDADEESLVWISPQTENQSELIQNSKASVIIVGDSQSYNDQVADTKTLIITENPKLSLVRVLQHFFVKKESHTIHPTAVIHPRATLNDNILVGANSYIGDCQIGNNTVLRGNNYVHDQCHIGDNVIIEAGVIIGSDGFGYARDPDNNWIRFPHIGKLIIHDDVEIGANSTIDKGSIGNTIIGSGTKISRNVNISHNCLIGKNCLIASNTTISGSVTLGNNVWIGPNSSILDKVSIGSGAEIGIGSIVTSDVPENSKVLMNRIIPRDKLEKPVERSDIEQRVFKTFKNCFPLVTNIHPDLSINDTTGWDSMGNVALTMALENEFDIEIDPDLLPEMNDLKGIIRIIKDLLVENT